MYAPYDVYNFCDLCKSACLGNEVEIVRQRTADLRKKVKLLEGDILNDADDCGPLFTIGTDESSYNLKNPPQTITSYNYRIYPVSLPGFHASQCVHPGAASTSFPPQVAFVDSKDAISKSGKSLIAINGKSNLKRYEGSTASSKSKSQESLRSRTKENNATKMSSECKEMVQLCTALISELREARTDLTTIVNKCLGDRANTDNVAAISAKNDEKVLTGRAEHRKTSRKAERKESSYKRSKHKEKKKYGKVKKDEKSRKDEKSYSNAKENEKIARPEVLTTLVDCLETMKTRPDCASAVEKLIDQLENKIVIKRSCDCAPTTSYNDVKFFKQNVEDSSHSSCQHTANYSCSEQGANVNLRTVPATLSTVPPVEFSEDKLIQKELQLQKNFVEKIEDDSNESKDVVQNSNISPSIKNSLVDLSMEKSDENKKLINYQEIYGGCRCHGSRQPYCTCGPYPEPPCGSEGVTVTRKCTQKSEKKEKPPKETKPTRKRPCFHMWPENTRCLKRCPNRK